MSLIFYCPWLGRSVLSLGPPANGAPANRARSQFTLDVEGLMRRGTLAVSALVVTIACVLAMMASGIAFAGSCQTCEYDAGSDAYVCYFTGYGNYGWSSCTPQWASEGEWCKFSGTFGVCNDPGGPCCYRYPATVAGRRPRWQTTQVLLVDLGGEPTDIRGLSVGTASVSTLNRSWRACRPVSGCRRVSSVPPSNLADAGSQPDSRLLKGPRRRL